MYNILISEKISNMELEFIIYNVVFSESRGSFTTEDAYQKLRKHSIEIEMGRLEELFEKWTEIGLIFENATEYVINSTII